MTGESQVDLFNKAVLPTETETETAPCLADGRPPRGLTPDGWVRTTGWLQFGDRPVGSAYIVALAGLLWALVVAFALLPTTPVASGAVTLLVPVLAGMSWSFFITRVKPASAARNIGTTRAADLSPGDTVRLCGSIGPVGHVTAVTVDEDIRIDFHRGVHRSWAPDHVVHRVELLD